ncbi:TetR/AcrR family transcriptional regulator [Saccharomonospora piscinae]|uniref:TetR/AcrR family transcriptional regulator n=1 Tax=Saccharomonospora piscinae TaxID=687388 RepID=UPI0011057F71|nr:TetR/AcrR family transcriptional regulator [Saccharomonospora piscinae]TLW92079.1 TetR/AcrR family transcriptional regulator [Saccharomonospora piscinae]
MPRTVDHGERRAALVEALLRVVERQGLAAATMRAVAAEAGMSLRLVQYYFDTKAALLNAALEHLERRSHDRWNARLASLPARPTARDHVEQFLAEALPTDGESRIFHLVWTSYAVLAMTDSELAHRPFLAGPERLERRLADTLERARDTGELVRHLDPAREAALLVNLGHGLGTSVLVGRLGAEEALAVLSHHLDQVLPRHDLPCPQVM